MKALPVLCVTVAASCATGGTSAGVSWSKLETAAAKRFVSGDEENKLGLQLKDELEQKQHVRYISDPEVVGYVNEVADRVLRQARADRPELAWHVLVIDDPKTVNAFATPGGFLYVYSGLLLATTDEAQLAAVLGHEAGHVTARHAARHLVDAYGLQAVTGLALGKNPGLLEQAAAGLVGRGALLAHSRAEEDEADELGARYAGKAGYDPQALVDFFEVLQQKEGRSPAIMTYLSDHPATATRIAHLQRYLAEHPFSGVADSTGRFDHVKHRVSVAAAADRFGM